MDEPRVVYSTEAWPTVEEMEAALMRQSPKKGPVRFRAGVTVPAFFAALRDLGLTIVLDSEYYDTPIEDIENA